MKKITIVTISFNQARFLKQTIESVLSQKYENLEYIIVDPGSTDDSRNIIESYRNKISKIIYKRDSGPAEGLNNGFAQANGEIYGYLNSDDIMYPNTLNQVNSIFSKKNIDVLSAHGYVIDKNNMKKKKIFSKKMNYKDYLYGNCSFVQPSSFFKSSIFKKVGGFNINNNIAWDGELMFDFTKFNALFHVSQSYWSGFRIYDSSISGSTQYDINVEKFFRILRKDNNISDPKYIFRKFNWFISWIKNPITLIYRLFANANLH
tara:strand:+ start:126 stop:911 length:786 start_codon:yes stop_codon:yes gene_type:complete